MTSDQKTYSHDQTRNGTTSVSNLPFASHHFAISRLTTYILCGRYQSQRCSCFHIHVKNIRFLNTELVLQRQNYFHNSHRPQCTIPQSATFYVVVYVGIIGYNSTKRNLLYY